MGKPLPMLKGEYLTEEQWKAKHLGVDGHTVDQLLEVNFRRGLAGYKPGEWLYLVCRCGAWYPKRRATSFERPRYNEAGQRVILVNPPAEWLLPHHQTPIAPGAAAALRDEDAKLRPALDAYRKRIDP